MLDRLPTELLRLVIDATSHSIWMRARVLDALGGTSKSYRRSVLVLRGRIARIRSDEDVKKLLEGSQTRLKAVSTLLIGNQAWLRQMEHVSHKSIDAMLAVLPEVRHLFVSNTNFDGSEVAPNTARDDVWFELNGDSIKKHFLSLSIRASSFQIADSVELAQLAVRNLRLDTTLMQPSSLSGLERLLSREHLPQLRNLRLEGSVLPNCAVAFLDGLTAIQLDLWRSDPRVNGASENAFFRTATPVLYSIGGSFRQQGGYWADQHVEYFQVNLSPSTMSDVTSFPLLKAVLCPDGEDIGATIASRGPMTNRFPLPPTRDYSRPFDARRWSQHNEMYGSDWELDVVNKCTVSYDFVQPAFLEYIQTKRNEQDRDPRAC